MTRGRCIIEGARVGEVAFNGLGPAPILTAKLALVSSGGSVHGYTQRVGWGEEVQKKLQELLVAIETEVTQDLFPTSSTLQDTPVLVGLAGRDPTDGVPSL